MSTDIENHNIIIILIDQFDIIYKDAYIYKISKLNELLLNNPVNARINMINDINRIFTEVRECILLYNNISTQYRQTQYELNIKLCNFLYNYLFYIYQYYIILNDYTSYYNYIFSNRPTKRTKTSDPESLKINLFKYIDKEIKPSYNQYTQVINNLQTYKKFIIYRFNAEIIDNKQSFDLTLFRSNIYLPPPDNGYNFDINSIIDADEIISNIKNYIRAFRIYIVKYIFILHDDNDYIAIPQYEGICWFISMITALTYSDLNRKLINDKIIAARISEDSSSNNFLNFMQFIINNISNIGLTYRTLNSNKQIILNYIKTKPIKVIQELVLKYWREILYYTESNSQQFKTDIKNFIDRLIELNINYIDNNIIRKNLLYSDIKDPFGYIILYNLLKTSSISLKDNDIINIVSKTEYIFEYINTNLNTIQFDYFAIYDFQYYILKYLYFLLNIQNLYCRIIINPNGIKSFHKLLNDNIIQNPEVIILHTSEILDTNMYDRTNIANMSLNDFNDIITYNDNKYKLDYLLQASEQSLSCTACGHCISGIKYHDKNYIHDSKNIINTIRINKEHFHKACPLIRHDWTSNIFNDICFSIEKCGYNFVNKESISMTVQNTASINLCYKADKNYTLVYVKIPDIASVPIVHGGNCNKYISLQEKIEFIYKNRKYSRTLYSKNNKKYFLFNKEYHLLSKIKNLKI